MERTIAASTDLHVSRETACGALARVPALAPIDVAFDDVAVEFGTPRSADGEVWLPVSWSPRVVDQPTPTFVGVADVRQDGGAVQLWLAGTYAIPLRPTGRFGDAFRGRSRARRIVSAVLERLAFELDGAGDATLAGADVARGVVLREAEPPSVA